MADAPSNDPPADLVVNNDPPADPVSSTNNDPPTDPANEGDEGDEIIDDEIIDDDETVSKEEIKSWLSDVLKPLAEAVSQVATNQAELQAQMKRLKTKASTPPVSSTSSEKPQTNTPETKTGQSSTQSPESQEKSGDPTKAQSQVQKAMREIHRL